MQTREKLQPNTWLSFLNCLYQIQLCELHSTQIFIFTLTFSSMCSGPSAVLCRGLGKGAWQVKQQNCYSGASHKIRGEYGLRCVLSAANWYRKNIYRAIFTWVSKVIRIFFSSPFLRLRPPQTSRFLVGRHKNLHLTASMRQIVLIHRTLQLCRPPLVISFQKTRATFLTNQK